MKFQQQSTIDSGITSQGDDEQVEIDLHTNSIAKRR